MKHTFLKVLMVALYAKVVASDYQELFFDVKLDHNSPHNKHAGSDGFDDMAFQMRYLVDDTYFSDPFNKDKLRPILFYAGNEGDITGFYNNSGFITTTLAEQWGGLVVFGEHRYFGQSYPFDKDEAFKVGNNAFLTVENVMMDYVQLIKQIKVAYNATDKAVMVFGGSYGGMLASWMRMKFPQHFQGALASSAPILYFKDSPDVPEDAFSLVATQDYAETFPDQRCSKGIKEGFQMLNDTKKNETQTLWPAVSELFHTCMPVANVTDMDNLIAHLENGYLYMAMTDYPYESSFLQPMPAWPVTAACEAFKDVAPPTEEEKNDNIRDDPAGLTDRQKLVLTAMKGAADIYFNYTDQANCTDTTDTDATGALDGAGWNVLACNELAMPTSMGKDSMFLEAPWDDLAYADQCKKDYGLSPNWAWALMNFGGYNINLDFQSYSNIIFSNGNLDPWKAGGVQQFVNANLPVLEIRGAAHHLDLRLPVDVDKGTEVEYNREVEALFLEKWIREYQTTPAPGNDSEAKIKEIELKIQSKFKEIDEFRASQQPKEQYEDKVAFLQ